MQTYGENLIEKLLKTLPPQEYFWCKEPHIANTKYSTRQNPDFIIVGAWIGVVVLEVKDWVQIKEMTQSELVIVRRDETPLTVQNPVLTAREYTRNLLDNFRKRSELIHHGGRFDGKLKFPWKYAVALPNIGADVISQAVEIGIWDEGSVLGKEHLTPSYFQQAIQNIPGGFRLREALASEILNLIRGVVDPRLVVIDASGKDVGTLTPTQEAEVTRPIVVKPQPMQKPLGEFDGGLSPNGEALAKNTSIRLIRGVAGSGKSLVLARRANFIAEQYPEYSILVVTFNVDLSRDLKSRIGDNPHIEVTNFHKLCRRLIGKDWRDPKDNLHGWLVRYQEKQINEFGLTVNFVADEIKYRKDLEVYDSSDYLKMERIGRGQALSTAKRELINQIFDQFVDFQYKSRMVDWDDVPRLTLAALQPGHPDWHRYDAVLIDEAQDFAPTWFKVVKGVCKSDGYLFLCDDPTQSIFRYTSWAQKGIDVVGKTRVLQVPFRNTRSITEAAHSLVKNDPILSQSSEIPQPQFVSYGAPTGSKPKLIGFTSLHDEVKYTEQHIQELLKNGTAARQIAILCHRKELTKWWVEMHQLGVYVKSFWKMKGLEFDVVFVPHLDSAFDQSGLTLDATTVSEIRRRIFTAMTRARSSLILSYQYVFPKELEPIKPYVDQVEKHQRLYTV